MIELGYIAAFLLLAAGAAFFIDGPGRRLLARLVRRPSLTVPPPSPAGLSRLPREDRHPTLSAALERLTPACAGLARESLLHDFRLNSLGDPQCILCHDLMEDIPTMSNMAACCGTFGHQDDRHTGACVWCGAATT
jgi:hypothetical protein